MAETVSFILEKRINTMIIFAGDGEMNLSSKECPEKEGP